MDAVVNVLLPAAFALSGSAGARNRALELYHSHPKLQENALTREAAALLRANRVDTMAKNACEQQGLIHIYRLMTQPVQPVRQLPLV
jgi:hypothetical protein